MKHGTLVAALTVVPIPVFRASAGKSAQPVFSAPVKNGVMMKQDKTFYSTLTTFRNAPQYKPIRFNSRMIALRCKFNVIHPMRQAHVIFENV